MTHLFVTDEIESADALLGIGQIINRSLEIEERMKRRRALAGEE